MNENKVELGLFAEGGFVESGQWILLGSAALLCLWQLLRKPGAHCRAQLAFLALLYSTLLLREVDLEASALPEVLIFLGSGTGRNILLGGGWAAFFWFAVVRWRTWIPGTKDFLLRNRASWAVVAGCVCYAAGYPFDKEWLPLGPFANVAAEEVVELTACFFFFASAALLVSFGRTTIAPDLPLPQPQ